MYQANIMSEKNEPVQADVDYRHARLAEIAAWLMTVGLVSGTAVTCLLTIITQQELIRETISENKILVFALLVILAGGLGWVVFSPTETPHDDQY